MPTTVEASDLPALVGTELGESDWLLIDQDRVDAFADATLDHQFIHVDPDKAAMTPFGGTVAHGFLTLSLLPYFMASATVAIEGTLMALNYGTDKVRFIQPVKVGSRIRARVSLMSADERSPGQWLLKQRVTIEIEGEDKPAMVAEMLSLFFLE